MADPVTMAVVGGTAGAMLSPKDPLKGALLGAAGGYGGGALFGGLGATGTAATTAAGTGGGFAGGGFGSVGIGGHTALGSAGTGGGFLSGTMAGLGKDFDAIGQFSQQNPVLTEMAMGTGMQALQPKMPQTGSLIQGGGNQMQFTQMPTQPFMPNRKNSLI